MERSDFDKTLLKNLKRNDREHFVLMEIEKLEQQASSVKAKTLEAIDIREAYKSKLNILKTEFNGRGGFNRMPDEFKSEYLFVKAQIQQQGQIINISNNEEGLINNKIKQLKSELREIKSDALLKFFAQAAKGFISREKYLEIWEKANLMYEESVLEICEKSMDELRKQYHAN